MNRGKKTLLVLLALGVAACGAIGARQPDRKETVRETAGSFILTQKTADDLIGLSWTGDGETISFRCADGVWTAQDASDPPARQETFAFLSETVLSLKATRRLENVGSLADYGLDKAAFTVTADWKDGTSTVYYMGGATPFADGYYLALSGESGTVYTVAASLAESFEATRQEMTAPEKIMEISYDSLAYAEFETGKGTCSFTAPDAGNAEGEGADDGTFRDLWSQVNALEAAEKTESLPEGDRVLAIRAVSRGGDEKRVVFTEYSADFYRAVMDDGTAVLVEADRIDALKRSINTMAIKGKE